ncbi:MAG TPA: hypothetical protein VGK48_14365 [Terriglobia bacterium]|jgi:hypothetical protein
MSKNRKARGGATLKNFSVKRNVFLDLKDTINDAPIGEKDKKAIIEMLPIYQELGMEGKNIRRLVGINIAAVKAALPDFKFIDEHIK